jgi:hypothetical protein
MRKLIAMVMLAVALVLGACGGGDEPLPTLMPETTLEPLAEITAEPEATPEVLPEVTPEAGAGS